MFLREKIKIWRRQVWRLFWYHLAFWNLALFLFVFLTGDASLFSNFFSGVVEESELPVYLQISSVAYIIATLIAISESLFSDRVMRKLPNFMIVLPRGVFYVFIAYAVIFFSTTNYKLVAEIRSLEDFAALTPELTLYHIKLLVFFAIAFIINYLFKEMYKKIGVANFRYWVTGQLNKPREEKRIFMFVDMKSSTTLAEKLGHKRFSHLVQDVFNDLAIVDNYEGEIYQYLGDGAIITWSKKSGTRNNNCIRAYFAFLRVIERRKRYYSKRYDVEPKFKAGLHYGDTMVLQVGNVKRDISYNGDAINTAARIESMCNEYKQSILLSGLLYEGLDPKDGFDFKEVGNIKLKGKTKGTQIYSVKQNKKKKKKFLY
ncbi:adenylate/guanylate cyclase domain-containing protein [Saccharicrinis aurantiacus]|uniref:adenylate/guanylate cyclase domain-containing protein n=1 Tax=Saccharicrinis aurantiacus TaxID=1849719 RepID=UPI00094FEE4C|nr:adenylate/guanylate cyclase domain-containing protein [Saccharicrinis aurantiacus]